jgi:hypothetical protein
MACQQLISHVSASGRYLQNLAAEYHPRAVIGQIAAVKIYIEKLAGPNEAMQASEAIQTQIGPYLTASQKGDLQGLLNDAACKLPLVIAGKTPASASGGQQYWQDTFWRDVPKDVFEAIGDKSAPATCRMQKVFKYLADIGLRAPSEKTFSAMLALFFYADGCPAGITSATLLAAVQQIKDAWKAYIQEYRRSTPGQLHDNVVMSWPGVPAGVICVRLDFIRFMNIFGQIPCRTSHGSMQHLRRSVSGQPLTVFEANFRNRALTLEDTGEFSPRAGAGGPLAIDFQGHRGIAAGALVGAGEDVVVRPNGGEGRLALLGPAAELALPGPAAELALPAPAVGGEAAPARVSLAAVTAQLLADSARRDAEKKANAKNKKAAKKAAAQKKKAAGKKTAGQKKKAAGKKKTAGQKRAADTEDAAEEKTAGKKKKKTAGKTLKKIAKKRLILKKSKTLAKASDTHLVHDSDPAVCMECGCPDGLELADGNLAEICVWCKEAQDAWEAEAQADAQPAICKKPAARLKPVICKKPAIAPGNSASPAKRSGPVPPEADRKANLSADPTAQKIFFMRWGCSKCRWQAGCTKSCWRARDMEQPEDVN